MKAMKTQRTSKEQSFLQILFKHTVTLLLNIEMMITSYFSSRMFMVLKNIGIYACIVAKQIVLLTDPITKRVYIVLARLTRSKLNTTMKADRTANSFFYSFIHSPTWFASLRMSMRGCACPQSRRSRNEMAFPVLPALPVRPTR